MINSMTGFGRTELQTPDGQLQLEVRSVNHRYLDIQFKLPEGFRAIEQELRAIVATRLKRGKIDVSLSFKRLADKPLAGHVNVERTRQIIEQLETIAALVTNPAPIDPATVIRMPGVIEEEEIIPDTLYPAAREALTSAIAQLADNRAREGEKIHAMLESRCAEVITLATSVSERLPEVLTGIRQRLEKKIEALKVQIDNDRLEQELAIIAQKLDVSEELDRLEAHVQEVRNTLTTEEPVGRRLDFLMQELNREANTLGSKSADTETTQAAVDLKVIIEQMREQVQNVE
ncbi:MAG: YicC/YloC family endoribonuclease [Gammaproteobacteria bacterium]|jgi:uncharacterized protein (TIGR00255 family)|nr:YicC family protein [Chromatiales bacterium]MDP6674851.1 YicC/YloC family endoribonuclease [Gammaproteobacteria bacterium]